MPILLPRPSGTPSKIEGEFSRPHLSCGKRNWFQIENSTNAYKELYINTL